MGIRETVRENMWGRFVDLDGEEQITLNEQGDIQSLPVEVGMDTAKFAGQSFGGTLALASADGGFDPAGDFDTKIPEDRREECSPADPCA